MRVFLTFLMLVIGATSAAAKEKYNTGFMAELKSLGLEREAFLYALNWAGAGHSLAERHVVEALIDGKGVEPNPKAAIALACRSQIMAEYDRHRLVLFANLRLTNGDTDPVQCEKN